MIFINNSSEKSLVSFYISHKRLMLSLAGVIFIFVLWWILSLTINSIIIPDPLRTFKQVIVLLQLKSTYISIGGTLYRLLIAFVISFFIGSIIGLFAGLYPSIQTFLRPLIVTLRTLPTAAIILIFIVAVSSLYAPYYVTFLVIFPIAYESMVTGINNISSRYTMALRLEGPRRINSIVKVILPLSSPYVLLGVFQSLGLGMKVEIMSEILSGNTKLKGVGVMIKSSISELDMANVFAYSVLTIALIGIIEYILSIIKKKISNNSR